MSDEILERIKRIETIVAKAYKLAKLVRRSLNKTTDIFNENFKIFEENIDRNSSNIDKMVITLQELVGDAAKYDEANKDNKKDVGENNDIEKLYI